jgi:signal transduction histidine kinase
MRLTAKFIVTLALGMVVVLTVNAVVRLRVEVRLFEASMRRHAHVFGHALGNSVVWTWRTAGEQPALALVADANEKYADLDVNWVWLHSDASQSHRPRLPLGELESVKQGIEVARHLDSTEGPGELLTYVPVRVPDGRLGALQISESLQSRHDFVHAIVRTTLLTTVTLVLVTMVLASILGAVLVGRPTRTLVRKAERIGSGDLSGPVELRQHDELGQIAGAMNVMCERLAAATEARIAATEQLRHADRLMTVGQLAAGMAHELGTPLNVVAGRAQMIAAGESVGQEAEQGATIIVEQTKRMTQIIRQLLDFARPRKSQKSTVDLKAVVQQTLKLLAPLAQKRGVELVAARGVDVARALVDEGKIQQVLTNLVVNAIHATAAGTITVAIERARVRPPADHGGDEGDYLRVDVIDSGHGMDEATAARVFEPFFTTKPVGEGTGLGLSVSYGIVKEHGGWIAVASHKGKGSTFSIYLRPEPSA